MTDSFTIPWTVACQAPLSIGFPRQEYWSGSLFPSPEDFPDPGIEPPGGTSGKEPTCQCRRPLAIRRPGFNPCIRKIPGERNSDPLQYSCLGNPVDKGAWWAIVHGVTRVGHDLAAKPPAPPNFLWGSVFNFY